MLSGGPPRMFVTVWLRRFHQTDPCWVFTTTTRRSKLDKSRRIKILFQQHAPQTTPPDQSYVPQIGCENLTETRPLYMPEHGLRPEPQSLVTWLILSTTKSILYMYYLYTASTYRLQSRPVPTSMCVRTHSVYQRPKDASKDRRRLHPPAHSKGIPNDATIRALQLQAEREKHREKGPVSQYVFLRPPRDKLCTKNMVRRFRLGNERTYLGHKNVRVPAT